MYYPELSSKFSPQTLPIPTYIPLEEYPKEPQRKPQKSRRDFPCPDCSNIYRSPRDQQRHHLVKHRPEEAEKKKFVCTFSGCNHKSAQLHNLKVHYLMAHCERSKVDQPCPLASEGCTWRWVDTSARTRHMQRVHGQKPHHRPDYKGRATPKTTKRRKVESATLLDDAKRVAAEKVANLQKARRVHISTKPAILPIEAPCPPFSTTSSHLESSSAVSASGSLIALISSSSSSSPILNSLEGTVESAPNLCPQASPNRPRSDSSDPLGSSITSFSENSASYIPALRSRRISFSSSRSSSPSYAPTNAGSTGLSSPLVVQSPPSPPSPTGITWTSMSTPEPTFDRSKKQLFA